MLECPVDKRLDRASARIQFRLQVWFTVMGRNRSAQSQNPIAYYHSASLTIIRSFDHQYPSAHLESICIVSGNVISIPSQQQGIAERLHRIPNCIRYLVVFSSYLVHRQNCK
ncbi:hypothetical protein AVEN_183739-1 [Araneus ventricosus]|uniref:Uncharacterized protein n=1 Tax=Araneus ventricosus TaxID=182803 RepID=A0A4Y2TWA9_ARAVE|nr:hypothetical protein AVEN_136803-1 [Araneus ventricosus]GBO04331.1 hypothetical protein AVEN_183739-1 [Araneus ventricosus]